MQNTRTWFSKNGLTLLIWLVGLAFVAINWYKVMATDSVVMDRRITAVEEYLSKNDPLVQRFYVLEQRAVAIEDNAKETRERLVRIEAKIDNLYAKQANVPTQSTQAYAQPTPKPETTAITYNTTTYEADQSAQLKPQPNPTPEPKEPEEKTPIPPTVLGTLKKIVGL